MQKSIFMDKYAICSYEIPKNQTKFKNLDEIVQALEDKIKSHKIATLVSVFDNYKHTKENGGEINPEILNAKIIVFCFGRAIPNSQILAIRPRGLGISEFSDKFVFDFQEAPKEDIQKIIENWIYDLKK